MTYTKTIECNGQYREFFGFKGLLASLDFNQKTVKLNFEDDNLLHRWVPLTLMRSDPFAASGNSILETCAIYSSTSDWTKKGLLVGYQDMNTINVLDLKRSVEIYSPLNPKQIKYYNYRIHEKIDSSDVTVIYFQTKKNAFPSKTRIYGEGYIYYCNKTHLVKKVVMENHIDRLTMFPRWDMSIHVPSATKHRFEVNYKIIGNKIYTENASLHVKWIDPTTDDRIYFIKHNSRRNPIKNRLEEREYVLFSDMVDLDKEKKQKIEKTVFSHGAYSFYAPFIKSEWDKRVISWLDWKRLEMELNVNGKSLYEQAKDNALNIEFYISEESSETQVTSLKNYLTGIRKYVYPSIYNTKINEKE